MAGAHLWALLNQREPGAPGRATPHRAFAVAAAGDLSHPSKRLRDLLPLVSAASHLTPMAWTLSIRGVGFR